MGKLRVLLILIPLILLLAAPVRAVELHVMAPWSIRGAIDEISDEYLLKHPGVRLVKAYGVSSALAKQLDNGASAHIFIAAHTHWADYLKLKHRLSALTVTNLAYNSIVLVGPVASVGRVSSLEELLQLERVDVGNLDTCRREYAMEAFRNAGMDRRLASRIQMKHDGVASVERGEVDAAVVFRTDALAKKARILFALPQNLYSRVTYPIALTESASKNADALSFYRYLLSDDAKRVLVKHGFLTN